MKVEDKPGEYCRFRLILDDKVHTKRFEKYRQ